MILMVYLPVVCIPWRSPHRSSQIPVGLVGLPRAEGHWRVGPAGSSAWWVWPESHTTSDWQCQTRYWAVPLPPTSRGYKCACVQVYLKLVKQKRERSMNFFNQFPFPYDLFVSSVLWGVKILNLLSLVLPFWSI